MLLETQKGISRRALQFWVSGNSEDPADIFTSTYVNHQASSVEGGTKSLNLAGWLDLVAGHHAAFSRSTAEILMQIGEGNLTVTRWRFSATQSGEFMGVAPRHQSITWSGVQTDRFENGKIAESWVDWDMYRFFEGVGLIR